MTTSVRSVQPGPQTASRVGHGLSSHGLSSQGLPWLGLVHLAVLYVVWSTTYLAIKVAVAPGGGFPPWAMAPPDTRTSCRSITCVAPIIFERCSVVVTSALPKAWTMPALPRNVSQECG